MRTTLTLFALAMSLALNFGAYAADTSVPGATTSTPGSEAKGNPITPPDKGTTGTMNEPAETVPGATASTPGSESKGNPIPPPQ
jgi:hypothetical protein